MLMPFDALIAEAKRLRTENQTLRQQLAAISEPLTNDDIDRLSMGNNSPGTVQSTQRFAHAIHRAILERIDNSD